jgi:aspartyl-tRNA(Asn)/glutamyl-tRNA(Gln) amidotransferase subunit A
MSELSQLSISELSRLIRRGELSSVELTEETLRRIEQHAPNHNAFISPDLEAALAGAKACDAQRAQGDELGPLHGIALAHKDMFYIAGRTTTCGSVIRRNYQPDITATVLHRLEGAGAIYAGGLNMSEFAAGPTGHNEHYGNCRNPWNRAHITGGSSSGSGAAVAARIVPGALGSDTGGSVRLPAAMCGVVGLKPTYGLVSRYGAMPRAWSLDCVGPLTRTVEDNALLARTIAGHDAMDASTHPASVPDYVGELAKGAEGLVVGIPARYFFDDLAPSLENALHASIDVLREAGAEVMEIDLPEVESLFALGDTISKCEAATIHKRWMQTMPEAYGKHTYTRVEAGFHVPATRYLEALSLRQVHLQRFLDEVFARVDAIFSPVIPMEVPTIEETDHHGASAVPGLVANVTRLTRPINYLGLPGLSIPCGFTDNGLPAAFQLIGAPFSESRLYRLGHAYQQSTDWHHRVPPGLD